MEIGADDWCSLFSLEYGTVVEQRTSEAALSRLRRVRELEGGGGEPEESRGDRCKWRGD